MYRVLVRVCDDDLLLRYDGRRRAAGNDAQQVLPAADDAAGVTIDEVTQRHRHLLLHRARVVHLTADVEQLQQRHYHVYVCGYRHYIRVASMSSQRSITS